MMDNTFLRTEMLLGASGLEKLKNSRVLLFGVGGVGSFAAEALARSGIGSLVLVDNDRVSQSNLNRQIHATLETVGQWKVDVMSARIRSINPACRVVCHRMFFLPDSPDIMEGCDYVVDAVDTVTAKLEIVRRAQEKGIPVISAMGTGNKLDPTKLTVADIYETRGCPLAKVMRKELRARGVKQLKVVYSTEEPKPCLLTEAELLARGETLTKRSTPGSVAFVPPVAGMILASQVVKDLVKEDGHG